MWKLKHWLFGWDYIVWKNSADSGIARIRISPDGIVWYWRYFNIKLFDKISDSKQVIWLTCNPDKYIKE